MIRITLIILSVIGLLLGLWGVSSKQALRFTYGSKQHGMVLEIGDGELKILSRQRTSILMATTGSQGAPNPVYGELVEVSVPLLGLAILSGAVLTYCLMPFHRR